jgi:UDP-N-acetylglucosamine 4,6-dehydratase
LGRRLVSALVGIHKVTILSLSPEKQAALWLELKDTWGAIFNTVPGDICNASVLDKALDGVDTVIHAAALVRGCERHIDEAIHTNVKGTQRLIEAAKDRVDRVLLISTSAACNPSGVYGATKLLAERMCMSANLNTETRYSAIRLGNLIGSGVVRHFKRWRASNEMRVTDPHMTRFWITAEQAVDHILHCLDIMEGGEVFVPQQPSASLGQVMRAVAPDCKVNLVGPQPGESMHATLVAAHEARYATWLDPMFIIRPLVGCRNNANWEYDSYTNPWRLTHREIKEMVNGTDS